MRPVSITISCQEGFIVTSRMMSSRSTEQGTTDELTAGSAALAVGFDDGDLAADLGDPVLVEPKSEI